MNNVQTNWLVYYQDVIVGIHNATFITEFIGTYGTFVVVKNIDGNRITISYPETE